MINDSTSFSSSFLLFSNTSWSSSLIIFVVCKFTISLLKNSWSCFADYFWKNSRSSCFSYAVCCWKNCLSSCIFLAICCWITFINISCSNLRRYPSVSVVVRRLPFFLFVGVDLQLLFLLQAQFHILNQFINFFDLFVICKSCICHLLFSSYNSYVSLWVRYKKRLKTDKTTSLIIKPK